MPINPIAAAYLAYFAYIDDAQAVVDPADFVKCLGLVPQGPANGPWQLMWGPAVNSGLLSYVAKGADGTFAVAFRGTDTDDEVPAFSENVIADLQVDQVPWVYQPSPDPTKQISAGTNGALALAMCMPDPAEDLLLLDYLRSLAATGISDLMVVGHSLGGAMATAATAFLADQLPQARSGALTLSMHSFAAPSVWSQGFATWFMGKFSYYAAANNYDIVPKAWADLNGITKLFPNPGPAIDWLTKGIIEVIATQVPAYVAITPTDTFDGTLIATTDWYSEADAMHSMANIYFLHATGTTAPPIPGAQTGAAARPRLASPRAASVA